MQIDHWPLHVFVLYGIYFYSTKYYYSAIYYKNHYVSSHRSMHKAGS